LAGLLKSIKDGGDWDVSAEGQDWRVQPSCKSPDPEPIVEIIQWDEKTGDRVVRKRFRIELHEEIRRKGEVREADV